MVKISPRKNQVPSFRIDQHGALAVPADAGLRGMIAFQDWPGVDVTFLHVRRIRQGNCSIFSSFGSITS